MTELTKNYIEVQFENQKLVKECTCMLLTDDKYQKYYKVEGTGILLQLGDFVFLISAAHVFDHFEDLKIPLKTENSLLKPGGELFINEVIGSRKEDRIDIGFLKLDEQSKNELQLSYDFLNQENIEINHQIVNHQFYSFFGYPTSLSGFSKTRNSFHLFLSFNLRHQFSWKNIHAFLSTRIIILSVIMIGKELIALKAKVSPQAQAYME